MSALITEMWSDKIMSNEDCPKPRGPFYIEGWYLLRQDNVLVLQVIAIVKR